MNTPESTDPASPFDPEHEPERVSAVFGGQEIYFFVQPGISAAPPRREFFESDGEYGEAVFAWVAELSSQHSAILSALCRELATLRERVAELEGAAKSTTRLDPVAPDGGAS